ncbi:unnamed protein product [Lathyrus oleraceus]
MRKESSVWWHSVAPTVLSLAKRRRSFVESGTCKNRRKVGLQSSDDLVQRGTMEVSRLERDMVHRGTRDKGK